MSSATAAAPLDLKRSTQDVRDAAGDTLTDAARDAAARLRGARAPYAYRYAPRIAASASATTARARGDVLTAQVKIAGRSRAFSGGGTVSALVWGAEFGATTGDVVRVTLSTGTSRTVQARHFRAHAARSSSNYTRTVTTKTGKQRRVRATATTGTRTTVTAVRRGGLSQFPTRRRDGWFLTPALDQYETQLWSDTDAAFIRALDG